MSAPWTLRLNRNAVEALYRFPRGKAADVTNFLHSLTNETMPAGTEPVDGAPMMYRYTGNDFQVIYELDDSERIIRVLNIRPYTEV